MFKNADLTLKRSETSKSCIFHEMWFLRPTNHPDHVEGVVQDGLLTRGKTVSIHLHGNRFPQKCDQEPQIWSRMEEEFNHWDPQNLPQLRKKKQMIHFLVENVC